MMTGKKRERERQKKKKALPTMQMLSNPAVKDSAEKENKTTIKKRYKTTNSYCPFI